MVGSEGEPRVPFDRILPVIMAGGGSLRFGRPKAVEQYRGRALWEWAARAVSRFERQPVALVNDAVIAAQIRLEARGDDGRGPLDGLRAALNWAEELGDQWVAIVGCDMPWVPPSVFESLAVARQPGRPVVAASAGPWGFEPLCAMYPVQALPKVADAVESGDLRMGAAVRHLDPVIVEVHGGRWALRSANHPEDLLPTVVAIQWDRSLEGWGLDAVAEVLRARGLVVKVATGERPASAEDRQLAEQVQEQYPEADVVLADADAFAAVPSLRVSRDQGGHTPTEVADLVVRRMGF